MKLTLLYLLLLASSFAVSQPVVSISIGSQQEEESGFVQPLSNGGFLVMGQVHYKGNRSDIIINRLDSNLVSLWSITIDNRETDRVWSALELNDGNILITTTSSGDRSTNDYTYLSLIDGSTGNIIWVEQRGGNQDRLPYLKQLDDGSILQAGMLEGETGSSWNKFTLVKRDANFNIEWQYYYNHLVPQALESKSGEIGVVDNILEDDDGYLLLGMHNEGERRGMRLLKVNKQGDFMWLRQLHFPLNYNVKHVIPFTKSGIDGYLIAGGYTQTFDGLGVAILTFLDEEGKHVWTKNYAAGKNTDLRYLTTTQDGCAVAIGSVDGAGQDGKNMFALKINSDGNLVWARTYGGDADDIGTRVYNVNGRLLMSGTTRSTPVGNQDIYLVYTDTMGNISRECMRDITPDVLVFTIKPFELSSIYQRSSLPLPIKTTFSKANYLMSGYNVCASCTDIDLGLQDQTKSICDGKPLVLHLPPIKGQYYWSTGQKGNRVTIDSTGSYWVRAENHCDTATDTFLVDERKLPTVPDIKDTVVCFDDSISITIPYTSNHEYIWLPMDTALTSVKIPAGKYTLLASNNCGVISERFTIKSVGDYNIAIPVRTTCLYDTINLNLRSYSSQGINIYWPQYQDSLDFRTLTDSGSYSIITERCDIIKQTDIEFNWAQKYVFIPNAFTPNASGLIENEEFKVGSYVRDDNFKLTIFNRWGELIFQTVNPDNGWDGTYKGKPVPQGVYLYVLSVTNCDGRKQYLKGDITLLR